MLQDTDLSPPCPWRPDTNNLSVWAFVSFRNLHCSGVFLRNSLNKCALFYSSARLCL